MSPLSPEFLLRHGHRLALTVAALLALGVPMALTTSPDATDPHAVDGLLRELESRVADVPPAGAVPAVVDPGRRIRAAWGDVSATREPRRWTFHRVPPIRVSRPPALEVRGVCPPTAVRADAGRERVVVRWCVPAPFVAGRRTATVIGYRVTRRQVGAARDAHTVDLGPEARALIDGGLASDATYDYRVQAVFDATRDGGVARDIRGGTLTAIAGRPVRLSAAVGTVAPVTTLGAFVIRFERRFVNRGVFHVWKRWGGHWWALEVRPVEGQPIGATVSARQLMRANRRNVAVHGTPEWVGLQQGRPAELDWRTDAVYLGARRVGRAEVAYIERDGSRVPGPLGAGGGRVEVLAKTGRDAPR